VTQARRRERGKGGNTSKLFVSLAQHYHNARTHVTRWVVREGSHRARLTNVDSCLPADHLWCERRQVLNPLQTSRMRTREMVRQICETRKSTPTALSARAHTLTPSTIHSSQPHRGQATVRTIMSRTHVLTCVAEHADSPDERVVRGAGGSQRRDVMRWIWCEERGRAQSKMRGCSRRHQVSVVVVVVEHRGSKKNSAAAALVTVITFHVNALSRGRGVAGASRTATSVCLANGSPPIFTPPTVFLWKGTCGSARDACE
jgi:hypothetical protein